MRLIKFKRKKKKSKNRSTIHARKRFFERFGVELNDDDYKQIVNKIEKGRAKYLDENSNAKCYLITYKDVTFKCVYSHRARKIITFLREDQQFLKSRFY